MSGNPDIKIITLTLRLRCFSQPLVSCNYKL